MFKKLGELMFSVYFLSAMMMGTYYNWQFAKEHGFVAWIFLGEVIPTLKGIAWPYFLLRERAEAKEETMAAGKIMVVLHAASKVGSAQECEQVS